LASYPRALPWRRSSTPRGHSTQASQASWTFRPGRSVALGIGRPPQAAPIATCIPSVPPESG
jgi:hypothetical protein